MSKRITTILIIISIILLTSCSSSLDNSDKININFDEVKFKDEVGSSLTNDNWVIFLDATYLFIEWYNIYVENPRDERLKIIIDDMNRNPIDDMQKKMSANLLNTDEIKMHMQYTKLGKEIITRALEDIAIEKELIAREKNSKNLTDEELEELKDNREEHLSKIKEGIMDILDDYYTY